MGRLLSVKGSLLSRFLHQGRQRLRRRRFLGRGDQVRGRELDDKWIIDGKSDGNVIDSVKAHATCIKRARRSESTWTAPNPSITRAGVLLGSTYPACFLTRVGGHLSAGTKVGVSRVELTYALTGRQPEGHSLTGSVRCVN